MNPPHAKQTTSQIKKQADSSSFVTLVSVQFGLDVNVSYQKDPRSVQQTRKQVMTTKRTRSSRWNGGVGDLRREKQSPRRTSRTMNETLVHKSSLVSSLCAAYSGQRVTIATKKKPSVTEHVTRKQSFGIFSSLF